MITRPKVGSNSKVETKISKVKPTIIETQINYLYNKINKQPLHDPSIFH
jgi:hypothetical protein